RTSEMHMHIAQTGNQKFSIRFKNLRAGWKRDGFGRSERDDFIFLNENSLIRHGRSASHVNHGDMHDRQNGILRFSARTEKTTRRTNKREKYSESFAVQADLMDSSGCIFLARLGVARAAGQSLYGFRFRPSF